MKTPENHLPRLRFRLDQLRRFEAETVERVEMYQRRRAWNLENDNSDGYLLAWKELTHVENVLSETRAEIAVVQTEIKMRSRKWQHQQKEWRRDASGRFEKVTA